MSRWNSPGPDATAALMQGVSAEWWIAGGWAIEMFVGKPVREHSDLEIGCLRRDAARVIERLAGWEVMIARNKQLESYDPAKLMDSSVFSIWCRPDGCQQWAIEIIVEDCCGADWLYRRDARVRRPIRGLIACTGVGLPYLCPEVQLLYKSKSPRPKDDADFAMAGPLLSAAAKAWLMDAVRRTSPECLWEFAGID